MKLAKNILIKLKLEQEINRYKKSIEKNKSFIEDSLEGELKYIAHNKKRYVSALREIDKLISKFKGTYNILDIGTSPFTFILQKRYKNAQIYSIDYTDKFNKICKLKKIHFKKVDLNKEKILFGKIKFDLVVFLEVLEHLNTNHKKVIGNIVQTMSTNSFCILQTPNKYSPRAIVTNVLRDSVLNKLSRIPPRIDESTHVKEYSLNELIQLIRNNGNFKVIIKEYSMYFDEIDSVLTYRKYPKLFKPLAKINYYVAKNISFLRRGMQIIVQKIS